MAPPGERRRIFAVAEAREQLRPFCHHHVLRGANRGEYLVGNFNSKYAWYSMGDFNRMGFTRDLSMMPLFGSGGGVVWCNVTSLLNSPFGT
eukprot:SAG11_NODE_250_length_11615_cov_25.090917_7_plen_91_part_00